MLWAQENAVDQAANGAAVYWDQARAFLQTQGLDLALRIVAAAAIFVIGRWVALALIGFLRRVLARGNFDPTLSSFVLNTGYAVLLVLVVIAALDRLGVDTTSLAAMVAAAGLAIGLALQNSLSNLAAGVMIITFRPFRAGNYIEAAGTAGIVQEVRIFNTLLLTPDNREVTVPNGSITSGNIVNYSARPTRRIDIVVGCGYEDDLRAVKQFLFDLVGSHEKVLVTPAPQIGVDALADNSVNFVVRVWVNSPDFQEMKFWLMESVKTGFDERGFSIPFPQRDVHLYNEDKEKAA